jgi:protein-disulfide isomerase
MADLMAEGPLPDIAIGSKDAPVTIVEYASMTCPHCAHFHAEVFPTLKSRYVDTGKVRFILREFPLDPLAAAGFMLARCAGPDKRDAIVELLYAQQKTWAVPKDPAKALLEVLKQAGFTQESFDSCLKDTKLYESVLKTREIASEKFKVESTPTFFINGKKEPGAIPLDKLDQTLEPFLKGSTQKVN